MKNVLEFMSDNQLNDLGFVAVNFDQLMTVSNFCSILNIHKIGNLTIDSNNIKFNAEIERPDSFSIPILESSGYGNRYSINSNIINNILNINMEVSTVK